jgi:hypothetical protein
MAPTGLTMPRSRRSELLLITPCGTHFGYQKTIEEMSYSIGVQHQVWGMTRIHLRFFQGVLRGGSEDMDLMKAAREKRYNRFWV